MRKRLGIKKLILLMGLLPTLAMSLVLGAILTYAQLRELKSAVVERASHSGQQFARLSAHFLQPVQKKPLQTLAIAALEEPGLRNVAIFDSNFKLLVQAGPNSLPDNHRQAPPMEDAVLDQSAGGLHLLLPIPPYPSQPPTLSADAAIGWVSMTFSWHHYQVRKYQTLLGAIVFLILTLLLSLALASYINRVLRADFAALGAIIQRLIEGDRDYQAHLKGNDEFSDIAERLNQLSEAHRLDLQELNRGIEQTNCDLRETLETLEVQNIELDLARREAIKASKIKSEFLANTSHEIRTPLNSIIGFTRILLRSELEQRQLEAVETIRQSADNLLTIINDILDFSKLEAGKLVFDQAPVDLRELLEDTLLILAPSAYEKELELALFIDPSTPEMVMSDSLRLKQIITNLLNNAIKFTASGHVRVDLLCNEIDDQQASLTLQVSDTGIGLSREQQQRIFQDFIQADASITRQYGGTGLGLVIVKGLVQQMGGEIGIDSEVGRGATFWLTLRLDIVKNAIGLGNFNGLAGKSIAYYDRSPLHSEAVRRLLEDWGMRVQHCRKLDELASDCDYRLLSLGNDEVAKPLPEQGDSASPLVVLSPQPQLHQRRQDGVILLHKPVSRRKLYDALHPRQRPAPVTQDYFDKRVLIVDDNPANLHILKRFLDDLHVQYCSAQNGMEALQRCRENRFDLILMDIQMPQMDGIETSRQIRSDSQNRDTPIIALSAYMAPENPAQLRDAGINDFLSKPIDERQLQSLFERFMQVATPALAAPRPVDVAECLRLAKHKADLAEEMLTMLLESLPAQLVALQAAAAEGQRQQLADIQHSLKGACCYTAAPLLKAAVDELGKALDQQQDYSKAVQHCAEAIKTLLQWQQDHDIKALFRH